MRIGIDGRELLGQATGVGRYLSSLLREWSRMPAAGTHELLVYTPDQPPANSPSRVAHESDEPDPAGARMTTVQVTGRGGAWWEQAVLARRAAADRLDVFFGPAYSVPLALAVPRAVTLHDISFETHPEWFGPREGLRRRWLARQSARTARAIVTVSEYSRREIVGHYTVDPSRVHVIPNGVDPPAAPSDETAGAVPPDDAAGTRPVQAADATGGPLVLYAGARFTRRNLPMLIAAFARVAERIPAARLTIAGPDRTYPPEDLERIVETAGVADRVTCLDYIDDRELAALYRRATLFAWLSGYEGFGLTPLEALAAGVPAVVGDIPVAREVYGDAVRYAPLGDPDAIAATMIDLLCDPSARAALLARRDATLGRYTWRRAAAATLAVLETAAAEGAR